MGKRMTPKPESGFEPIKLVEIERAGEFAFEHGALATDCPYAFIRSPYWETKDYTGFERDYHPKLDAWMRGWIQASNAAKGKK